jgi:hypothetical protein
LRNTNKEEERLEEDASEEKDTANIEEEENFFAGFGSFGMDEEDAIGVEPSTSQEEKWANRVKKRETKEGISKKEAKRREKQGEPKLESYVYFKQ